jgi:hypothetical protein
MNNEEITVIVGSNPTETTIFPRKTEENRFFRKVCVFYRKDGYDWEAWKTRCYTRFSEYPRVTVLPERRLNKGAYS